MPNRSGARQNPPFARLLVYRRCGSAASLLQDARYMLQPPARTPAHHQSFSLGPQPTPIMVLEQAIDRLARMGVSRNGRASPLRCPVPAIWPLLLMADASSRVQPESAGINSSSLIIMPSLH